MTIYKRFALHIFSGFWAVLLVALWLVFAPTQVGGQAAYVIIIGESMEPGFQIGDLVIAHQQPVYQVGEAVVYHNPEMERYVFHRIIAQELGRFILQGDNNPWIDTYQPLPEDVLGRLWIRIPQGGTYLQKLRHPIFLSLLVGLLAGSLFLGRSKGSKSMNKQSIQTWFLDMIKKGQHWLAEHKSTGQTQSPKTNLGGLLDGLFFSLGFLALASFILVIISFSQPATRTEIRALPYDHIGFFSYSASAPQGVYDANALKSGDPIFPRLTCAVDVNYKYIFMAQQVGNVTGTYQLTAVVSEPSSGWQRMMPLQNETAFSGNAFETTASLNLCQLESLIQAMQQETDFHSASYLLTISPNIQVAGEISGQGLDTSFDPNLTFKYDRVHFALLKDEESGNPLNPVEAGALPEERLVPNTILLLGANLEISTLRWLAWLGFIISAAGMTLLTLRAQRLARHDQAGFIRLRYQSLLIDVPTADPLVTAPVIEVASMDDLAKLAERFTAMILHTQMGARHLYYVQGGGNIYRFSLVVPQGRPTVSDTVRADA